MIIKVNDYIESAFSIEDAEKLNQIIGNAIKNYDDDEIIELDFSRLTYFTTLFFNHAVTQFVNELTLEVYKEKIKIKNISDIGQSAYDLSLDTASRYYKTPESDREVLKKILMDLEEFN